MEGEGGGAGVILIKSAVSILLEKCSFTMMCHQLGLQHWCPLTNYLQKNLNRQMFQQAVFES